MAIVGESGFERQLIEDGVLDQAKLDRARQEAEKSENRLADVLETLGFAKAEAAYQSLARFCELQFINLDPQEIPPTIIKGVPARFVTHYRFVPIKDENGALTVAISDPLDAHLLDDIRMVLKRRVKPVVATPKAIDRAIKALYGVGADTVERILHEKEQEKGVINLEASPSSQDLGDVEIDASIIKFVNEILSEAIQTDATDIHIEPYEEHLRVRYRIDGVLHQVPTPPSIRGFQSAIVSRVKIMANLNIAEKRIPQDGKILAKISDAQFDLRVSILPTPHGESINIRILSRSSMFLTLEQLGFRPEDMTLFNTFLKRPHGIILVTGPTGSGKTTTLYAALHKLNSTDRKTITIEDPIEYQLEGITQMQVLPQIGFDFSTGLRSMLRHDPDIMMVGEIRDYETAEMAIRSSLTGHLVFSTLHTNDAAGAVTRLTDMGVEPFLIASTMIASLAQRLVRLNCHSCLESYQPEPELIAEMRLDPEAVKKGTFKRGTGCDDCRHTGYKGRAAIYEILPFNQPIKQLTVDRATSVDIKRQGVSVGMQTLRQCGLKRAFEGQTTLEEILRVTAESELDD